MTTWAWPFVVLLGLAPMSCHVGGPARADVPEFNLNEPFVLAGGQEALMPSEKLRLRFTDVLEDSRRPTRVECFWTGRIDALRPVIERGIARGELRPDTDPALVLETLIAPLHGRLLLTGEPVDEKLGERIVDLVLDGARIQRTRVRAL